MSVSLLIPPPPPWRTDSVQHCASARISAGKVAAWPRQISAGKVAAGLGTEVLIPQLRRRLIGRRERLERCILRVRVGLLVEPSKKLLKCLPLCRQLAEASRMDGSRELIGIEREAVGPVVAGVQNTAREAGGRVDAHDMVVRRATGMLGFCPSTCPRRAEKEEGRCRR